MPSLQLLHLPLALPLSYATTPSQPLHTSMLSLHTYTFTSLLPLSRHAQTTTSIKPPPSQLHHVNMPKQLHQQLCFACSQSNLTAAITTYALTPTAALTTCTVFILCSHSKLASDHMQPLQDSMQPLQDSFRPHAHSLHALTPTAALTTCTVFQPSLSLLPSQLLHLPLALTLSYAQPYLMPKQLHQSSSTCPYHYTLPSYHMSYLMPTLTAFIEPFTITCTHALTPTAALTTCTVLILCNHSKPASNHMHTHSMLSLQLLHLPLALSLSYATTPSQLQTTCTLIPSSWSKLSPSSVQAHCCTLHMHAIKCPKPCNMGFQHTPTQQICLHFPL